MYMKDKSSSNLIKMANIGESYRSDEENPINVVVSITSLTPYHIQVRV